VARRPKPRTALPLLGSAVFLGGFVVWLFPRVAGGGAWLLPTLSVAALVLAVRFSIDESGLGIPIGALAAALAVGWSQVPNVATSTSHFAGASLGLLLMLLVRHFVDSQRLLRWALLAYLLTGLAVLLLGLASLSGSESYPLEPIAVHWLPRLRIGLAGTEAGGTINPNALAAAALLIAPFGLTACLVGRNSICEWLTVRLLGFVVLAVGVLVLVTCRSRSAWSGVWLTVVAMGIAMVARGNARRIGAALLATTVVAPLSGAVAWVYFVDEEKFVILATLFWRTVHGRAAVLAAGIRELSRSPWIGIGLNEFRNVYNPTAARPGVDIAHAHNIFLQTALDIGLLGLAAYCAVIIFLVRKSLATAGSLSPLCRGTAIGAVLSLVAATAFGLSDAVALGAKIGMFQWLAGGLALAAHRGQSHFAPDPSHRTPA
jgi:putative inorganic carbon (hco3(-)) transporter